ncbi:hypothetical protein [Methanimicrococcus blatticola]|uniref:Uncharacterized protein n=1 Tax=Methanimicrococcus blatticola TaxID=91560 RepID=A0A484F424_9EURY|nr:hypothetical protein [Methanimicrococcus blatticola]MBZ3935860.1 hypothetical protein [Methanimicrococcus blatticola]MCC2508019.1 hypothetical protein [Methanimicrococcus blatticola]TDQ68898.1 hypothetical protein C7391_1097 [Methanimicrococcus blatticola]
MSKKSLLIAVVLIFLLTATAMAIENKSASENFTSQEYLNAKSVESTSDIDNVEEGYLLQTGTNRWTGMFSALQPYSGNET